MVLAVHLVWTCYGWWFPNDLRGAWSREVWSPAMREFGEIEERGRREIQPKSHELRNYISAVQNRLKYEPFILDDKMRKIAENAIMEQARLNNYAVMALAVMAEHSHIVVGRHNHAHSRMVRGFKAVSSRELRKLLAASFTRRDSRAVGGADERIPVWSHGYWVRFLNTDAEIAAAVAYVNRQ